MRTHVVDPLVRLEAYRRPRQSEPHRLKCSEREKNTFFFYPKNHAHQYVNTIKIQTCVKMLNTQAIPTWPIPTTVTLLTDLVLDSVTSEKSCCFMVSIWWIYKIGFLFEHKILEFAKSCSTEIEIESESQLNLPSKCLL